MEHLINEPIEAEEMQGTQHHITECGGIKLCFFYHRGLAVGYNAKVYIHGQEFQGEIVHCNKINANLFKCEVKFVDKVDRFKLRMLEQAVRIERFQKENPEMTLEEAANKWVEENGALFPEE